MSAQDRQNGSESKAAFLIGKSPIMSDKLMSREHFPRK
jgi:hypothetical protein